MNLVESQMVAAWVHPGQVTKPFKTCECINREVVNIRSI